MAGLLPGVAGAPETEAETAIRTKIEKKLKNTLCFSIFSDLVGYGVSGDPGAQIAKKLKITLCFSIFFWFGFRLNFQLDVCFFSIIFQFFFKAFATLTLVFNFFSGLFATSGPWV